MRHCMAVKSDHGHIAGSYFRLRKKRSNGVGMRARQFPGHRVDQGIRARLRHRHGFQTSLRQTRAETVVIRHRNEGDRSEEHTSELQSLMRISYAVFCLK